MKGITSGDVIIIAQSKSCGAAAACIVSIANQPEDHKYSSLYCGFDS
jgi:hypothetical protein